MKLIVILTNLTAFILISACKGDIDDGKKKLAYYTGISLKSDTSVHQNKNIPSFSNSSTKIKTINVGGTDPEEVVRFAQTLVGTPYVYGSINPNVGFDCSGFITYVFNHFNISVPRSSSEFINVGETVLQSDALPGDLILFTSPSSDNITSAIVGHMGLITSNSDGMINFVHSTSGKAMCVTITPLNSHYQKRFLRVCRIFSTP